MWSGGKDGAFAVWRGRERGLDVRLLLNFYDAPSRRVRFHATRAEVIAAQAAATRIPLRQIATTWEDFEGAFRGALANLKAEGFDGVIFGDIHLADVAADVARETVAAWPDLAMGTRSARPKAWGALAARGVSALRARLERKPTDAERRAIWDALWRAAGEHPNADR